jgi:hypothetical protein
MRDLKIQLDTGSVLEVIRDEGDVIYGADAEPVGLTMPPMRFYLDGEEIPEWAAHVIKEIHLDGRDPGASRR